MKKALILLTLLTLLSSFIFLALSCQKEELSTIPIYEAGEMLFGSATGKKAHLDWEASGIGLSHTNSNEFWGILLGTSEDGFSRENLVLGFISATPGNYRIAREHSPGVITSFYLTLQDDGDVLEDSYLVDESVLSNVARITKIDTVENLIEGIFTATFEIRDPEKKVNPNNPDRLTFSDVSFSVQIFQ